MWRDVLGGYGSGIDKRQNADLSMWEIQSREGRLESENLLSINF
jgi:hypothetical protein